MSKVLIGLVAVAVLALTVPVGKKVNDTIRANGITQEKKNAATEVKVQKSPDLLESGAVKKVSVAKTVVLEAKNTYVFRGPVTGSSVSAAMKAISAISRNIGKGEKIYLVLDTPGGSVIDGIDFIDFLEGIPQEITTVTLFAASMGFQITENNPGPRLITRGGTLMSHRAAGGIDGQFDGELESRYRMFKRKMDYLETVDANRMGITLAQYKAAIKDELWVSGFDAVEMKVADEMVLLQCGTTMTGTQEIRVQTMFGTLVGVFDACPLIRDPIEVRLGNIRPDAQNYVSAMATDMFSNKTKFVREQIVTNKFSKFLP